MKKKKEKPKKVNESSDKKNKDKKKELEVKQVGTFNGFLIFDKIDKENEVSQIKEIVDPSFKDWLIIQRNVKKTESRFSNLFQETLENDKLSEQQKQKNIIDIENEDEKLLPNNLIEENDESSDFDNNEIKNIDKKFENLNINIIENDSNNINNINNNIINNNFINNNENIKNKINSNINNKNNNIIINNNPNINNCNDIMNNKILFNYAPNLNNINNNIKPNNFNNMNNTFNYSSSNNSSSFPSAAPTAPSSLDRKSSIFSIISNSSGAFFGPKGDSNNNNYDYFNFSNKSSFHEPGSRPPEKKFDLNIDIKRILYLEDRRTTLMIKNIPNKFQRDLLLKIINQNFKGAYDLFILPTDANGYKNFGYSFINFTCSYYIPYFYFLFNNKKWSSTNSKKVCEITYSKIQGRNSLLSHYSNKIIYKNNEVKKLDSNNKYIIPNEYYNIFSSAFPNYNVEKFEFHFKTKMPFRY